MSKPATSWLALGLALILGLSACQSGTSDSRPTGLGPADRTNIEQNMAAQEQAWNTGDLTGFMVPYWHSDSLLFVGSKGPSYGWSTTLANYQSGYPTPEHMGQLHFDVLQLDPLGNDHAFMLGAWHLQRSDSLGDLAGHFTLIWARAKSGAGTDSGWHIISDHSS
jgi:hypothetical protein